MQQKIQGLTTTAELALQILTLDTGLGHSEDVTNLSAVMSSQLSFVETEISGTSEAVLMAVDEARKDTKSELAIISQDIQSRFGALERLITSQQEQLSGGFQAMGDLRSDFVRFLTFEALQMTHTCCASTLLYFMGRRKPWVLTIQKFSGNIEEIQEDEEELRTRLEALLSEFEIRFRESGRTLRNSSGDTGGDG
ncbi:uncharacterized protein DNG_06273 [Cephalotrichum gorgonifer]|uniref:Uncharacterized protein n=1 Tax=Cephalotrichum gorgonifer TaxID=2041049 RepID=A0AAE8MZK9_9PEZI|nr:uncharacterized protein DNG_06273 [Cephalotrichum gorgonifer]